MSEVLINKKPRSSGLELLKILAMLIICLVHATQSEVINVHAAQQSGFLKYLIKFIGECGNIGNLTFIICSAWFLIDSTKTKTEKAVNILLDSTFISIIILIGFVSAGKNISGGIIRQIFPDVYINNWFIVAYVIVYLLHPIFNLIIKNVSRITLFSFVCGIMIIFGILPFFRIDKFYNELVGFICVYFIIGYVKLYMKDFCKSVKINAIILALSVIVFAALVLIRDRAETNYGFNFQVNYLTSPIVLLISISLFNLFGKLAFVNKTINYISSCTLFIYIIHSNYLLRIIARADFYNFIIERFGVEKLNLFVLVCGVGMFVGSLIISIIYKETIHKFTAFLSLKIKGVLDKFFSWLNNKFSKNENID